MTLTAVIENTVPSAPGMIADVLTGLIVPVLVINGPPNRISALISADQWFQPASLPKSKSSFACAVPLYSLLVSVPPDVTP